MVLPPLGTDDTVDRDCADLRDVRVPATLGRYTDDPRFARPLGYYHGRRPVDGGLRDEPGPCNPTGKWGRNRHLFDALEVSEGDRYDAQDNLLPKRFQLVLTCIRCGLVEDLRGQLDPDDASVPGSRAVTIIDPTPLQAGPLLAQEIDRRHAWGEHWDVTWTVYAEGRRAGWLSTERGPRGKRYIAGALGRTGDGGDIVKGDTALAVLRKLSRLHAAALAPIR